jgi:sporulation protein YlmC with PRC-barrel domain
MPPGELSVSPVTRVEALDGHVGQVDEFLVNPQTGQMTHLALREGHLWGQKDVTIPVAQIDHISDDAEFLKLDTRH